MPQTMLAFLAMLIASLAAFSQMSHQLGTYDSMVLSEFELMANGVVLEQMEIIDMTTDYEDLEIWDGIENTKSFTIDDFSVDFKLVFQVQYIDDDGFPSENPTNQKELQIAATHEKFTRTLVRHRRLFSD